MKKKGEITTSYLVGLLLSIVGFVIVLFLLFSLEFDTYSVDEICKFSVLSRASLPEIVNNVVPLKCTTKKVCIVDGLGGSCSNFKGEENVRNLRLGVLKNPIDKADKIEEVLANEMLSCWNQMGQGKLDLFNGVENPTNILNQASKFLNIDGKASSCVICSRVALEDDLKGEELEKISRSFNLNEYLLKTSAPNTPGISYVNIFTDNSVQAYPAELKEDLLNSKSRGSKELAIVYMQILSKESAFDVFKSKAMVTGGFVFTSGTAIGGISGIIPSIKAAATLGILSGAIGAAGQYYDRTISAGYCGKFIGSDGQPGNGCSLIMPIDYNDISKLNEICGKIEGSP